MPLPSSSEDKGGEGDESKQGHSIYVGSQSDALDFDSIAHSIYQMGDFQGSMMGDK